MRKIKIISNPYKKQIEYQQWNEKENEWEKIANSNPESHLLNAAMTRRFFPFSVKEIVDTILKEYSLPNEPLGIVFEGTSDEYKELEALCTDEKYFETICLSKSPQYLENARDILPDIIEEFESIDPLISQSVKDLEKINMDLRKFKDASNDIIPICVLGNYSAGKSSFINALIGGEILPSGDEPITAKIYKVSRSKYQDRAMIKFYHEGCPIIIRFSDDGYKYGSGLLQNELTDEISQLLDSLKNEPVSYQINKALEVINGFEGKDSEKILSDMIEIEVPFVSGLWSETAGNFVIFDTPGSNSATNEDHSRILRDAMKGFSNGLPVYVATYDSLDSKDNDNLYREIKEIEELDERFTMIIVNKADIASLKGTELSSEQKTRIMGQSIPKHMYSSGIYFVSSIMGLSAKNNGDFIDEHSAEVFETQRSKFENPDSRFYKMMYRYNIMPEQIKRKADEQSAKCENLIYANSGLYCIEREIQTFAGKYSPYNKCEQSKRFLDNMIEITSTEIDTTKSEREELKIQLENALEQNRQMLVKTIRETSGEMEQSFEEEYPQHMTDYNGTVGSSFSTEEIKTWEEEFTKDQESANEYERKDDEAKQASEAIVGNLVDNTKKMFKNFEVDKLKQVGRGLIDDTKESLRKYETLIEARKQSDREASSRLMEKVNGEFKDHAAHAKEKLDNESRRFWSEKTKFYRRKLQEIVLESSALSTKERDDLAEIIISYEDIVFEDIAQDVFLKEDFMKQVKILNMVLVEFDTLNIAKLTARYNALMQEKIFDTSNNIQESHSQSFRRWMSSLLELIIDNIVEYNPKLHSQNQVIKEINEHIHELTMRQLKLQQHKEAISRMMDWRVDD